MDRKSENPENWWRQGQTVNDTKSLWTRFGETYARLEGRMGVDEVIERFKRYSMVVVTKEGGQSSEISQRPIARGALR